MKRLKGMTLLEIVISLAIFALLSTLIVQCISSINTIIRRTTDLNERIYQEKTYINTYKTDFMDDVKAYEANTASGPSVHYNGKIAYPQVDVVERVTKNDGSDEARNRDSRLDTNLHFRFLEFDGTVKGSSNTEFNTGFITLTAMGSNVPEIVKVTIKGGDSQQVFMPDTTTPVQEYTLVASQLDGGDGKFSDGEQIFAVNFPEKTSVVEIEWVIKRNGVEETVKSTHSFPSNRLSKEGKYETVGKATAYYYNGSAFGLA